MSPPLPMSSEIKQLFRMSNYTQLEMSHVRTNIRMCFAANGEKALLTGSLGGYMDAAKSSRDDFRNLISQLPGVRCRGNFSCFNIYPTNRIALQINKLLWETAHNGYYDAVKGNHIFSENVFVLGMAAELFDFLVHVTMEELEQAINDFLVLLHHQLTSDGDFVGVAKLREELLPEAWFRLEQNIGVFENGEPKEAGRAAILEHLVQICFMTPWRVDVMAGYLTAEDTSSLLLLGPQATAMRMPNFGSGSVGVRGSALLKLFHDWQIYDEALCQRLGMQRKAGLEALDRAVYYNRNDTVYEEVATIADLCDEQSSYLSLLPVAVVERVVIPWIIRRNCETLAPRKRRLATLKSLLELSSRFFEELNETDTETQNIMNEPGFFGEMFEATRLESSLASANYVHSSSGGQSQQQSAWLYSGTSHDDSIAASSCDVDMSPASPKSNCSDVIGCTDEHTMDYPLNLEPPRYSRLERHGGIIDLSAVANGIAPATDANPNSTIGAFQNVPGYDFQQPESGPSSFSSDMDNE